MASPLENSDSVTVERVGVVVHPSRAIEQPLSRLREWTASHDAQLVQIAVPGREREVAEEGRPEDCDLIVAIGGDGTMLAAIRAAALADRPVLGVACGSLGALTTVTTGGLARALDRFEEGDWSPLELPALEVTLAEGDTLLALNDIAIVRSGQGQIRVIAKLDGALYGRFAGDGCIVSTPIGSSAYALAARGPLLAPGVDAFLLTPLPLHGGFVPPLVVSAQSELEVDIAAGHSATRFEVDGQLTNLRVSLLRVTLRPRVAKMVSFGDEESFLTGLRRRGIVADSPRILVDEGRA
jgi:NAD+ kinase